MKRTFATPEPRTPFTEVEIESFAVTRNTDGTYSISGFIRKGDGSQWLASEAFAFVASPEEEARLAKPAASAVLARLEALGKISAGTDTV